MGGQIDDQAERVNDRGQRKVGEQAQIKVPMIGVSGSCKKKLVVVVSSKTMSMPDSVLFRGEDSKEIRKIGASPVSKLSVNISSLQLPGWIRALIASTWCVAVDKLSSDSTGCQQVRVTML
jgi:hypothetical protein